MLINSGSLHAVQEQFPGMNDEFDHGMSKVACAEILTAISAFDRRHQPK